MGSWQRRGAAATGAPSPSRQRAGDGPPPPGGGGEERLRRVAGWQAIPRVDPVAVALPCLDLAAAATGGRRQRWWRQ
uniref:Uncharacterized protein n=1 Tax=Oryza rufipogon TaxID=4529 RepID=A0A0E0QP60_ORYRU